MENESKVTVENLGTFVLLMAWSLFQLVSYFLAAILSKTCEAAKKIKEKLGKGLFWSAFLLLGIEGYLDFCLSVFLNLEEPYFNNGDDIFNMLLTFGLLPCILALPFLSGYILRKNREKLHRQAF